MKPLILLRHSWPGRWTFKLGCPVALTLLLLTALTARADTPCLAAGWVIGQPLPGIWCNNALGQRILRGNVHLLQVESSEPRLAGRRTVFLNGDAQNDGSLLLHGTEYLEVGTWDGTVFTPSGEIWQATSRGVLQSDYSLDLTIVGYGYGGEHRGPAPRRNDDAGASLRAH